MAKQQIGKMFSALDEFRNLSNIPEINPDILGKIKPTGAQFKEALEPVYAELVSVKGELEKANKRAENAEERALVAEISAKRAYIITLIISILAIIIPFCQAVYYDYKNKEKDTKREPTSTTVEQSHQRVRILKNERSNYIKTLTPAQTQYIGNQKPNSKR